MAIQSEDCTKQVVRLITETHADVHLDPLLMKACQKDIGYLCGRLVPGRGQIIECLQVKSVLLCLITVKNRYFVGNLISFSNLKQGIVYFFLFSTIGFIENDKNISGG